MLFYYLLIAWVGIISIFLKDVRSVQKRNKIVIILSCCAIFLIQSLRSLNVGVDLIGYISAYEIANLINVFKGEKLFNYELGYILYSQLFSEMNFSNQLYLSVVALTIITPIAYIWIKNSKMPGLSVFIYITLGFFTFSFSGLRQAIAIGILFLSFKFIQEKSLVKFIAFVALAMSFHTSAIIFIIAYPLYYLRIKAVHYIFIIPFLLLTFIFKAKIFNLIYGLYSGVPEQTEPTNAFTMLFVMIFIFFLSLIFGSKDKKNLDFNAYKNYLLITIFIQIFASESNIVMRTGYYFYIFITLLIPEVIKYQQDIKIRLVATFVLIIALLYFFQINTGSGYLDVSPYLFYWN